MMLNNIDSSHIHIENQPRLKIAILIRGFHYFLHLNKTEIFLHNSSTNKDIFLHFSLLIFLYVNYKDAIRNTRNIELLSNNITRYSQYCVNAESSFLRASTVILSHKCRVNILNMLLKYLYYYLNYSQKKLQIPVALCIIQYL